MVGLNKQLLVDAYAVELLDGVDFVLNRAEKYQGGEPLITADQPWEEAETWLLGSVLRDGGRFRLWYRGGGHGQDGCRFGHAESYDGIHWRKPELGMAEVDGSKANNIYQIGRPQVYVPFIDPNEADPAKRYKAAVGSADGHGTTTALAYSPDGLRWTYYQQGKPITGRAADTINQVLWDPWAEVYRLYTRTDYDKRLGLDFEVRGTRDMVNPDLGTDIDAWTTVREWVLDQEPGDPARRQMYSFNGWVYEGIQFGLIWSFEWADDMSEGPTDLYRRHERSIMNAYLATARGDEPWNLRWVYANEPLIPRGPAGSFDSDSVQPAPNIVTWNDRHWIYYCGHPERHAHGPGAIGLATLPLDRFVALGPTDKKGLFTTKPLDLEGPALEINADASEGEIYVEVLRGDGRVIEGFSRGCAFPIKGADGLRIRPRWKEHPTLAPLVGKTVRLRFHMKEARIYAFQIVDGESAAGE